MSAGAPAAGERYRPVGYAAAMPGSRGGTVRSKAAGSSFARGRIAANGATTAPCTRASGGDRKTRAAQPRPDNRTVRPEKRAVSPPSDIERKKSAVLPKKEKGSPATRDAAAPKADPGPGDEERRAGAGEGGAAGASSPAPFPRRVRPNREIVRELEPNAVPAPGRWSGRCLLPAPIPATRPPNREIVRDLEPNAVPAPGRWSGRCLLLAPFCDSPAGAREGAESAEGRSIGRTAGPAEEAGGPRRRGRRPCRAGSGLAWPRRLRGRGDAKAPLPCPYRIDSASRTAAMRRIPCPRAASSRTEGEFPFVPALRESNFSQA